MSKKITSMSIRMEEELRAEIYKVAAKAKVPPAEVVRVILKRYFKKRAER